MQAWYLEGFLPDGSLHSKQPIRNSPFVVGRAVDSALVIASDDVSRHHAEFYLEDDQLVLRDLGSTNGTFVNHRKIADSEELVNGDVLHFGNVEYRVISQQSVSPLAAQDCGDSTMMFSGSLSNQLAMGSRELDELLNHAMVTMHFQPIVTPSGEIRAFEILGRGNHPVLPASPLELFSLAESVGEAVRLSEVFRDSGVALAAGQTELPLFLNIHPHELNDCDRLLRSLVSLREKYPCQALMLEIHEQVVTNLDKMHQIKRVLTELDIGLAYDDFGAGQARMLELVEIPPKCLKFDTSLVRGIATGSSQKRQVLAMLITLCKQLGIQSLAEGIETREDAEVCQLLGVDLIQGFFYSRPKPWDEVEKKQI